MQSMKTVPERSAELDSVSPLSKSIDQQTDELKKYKSWCIVAVDENMVVPTGTMVKVPKLEKLPVGSCWDAFSENSKIFDELDEKSLLHYLDKRKSVDDSSPVANDPLRKKFLLRKGLQRLLIEKIHQNVSRWDNFMQKVLTTTPHARKCISPHEARSMLSTTLKHLGHSAIQTYSSGSIRFDRRCTIQYDEETDSDFAIMKADFGSFEKRGGSDVVHGLDIVLPNWTVPKTEESDADSCYVELLIGANVYEKRNLVATERNSMRCQLLTTGVPAWALTYMKIALRLSVKISSELDADIPWPSCVRYRYSCMALDPEERSLALKLPIFVKHTSVNKSPWIFLNGAMGPLLKFGPPDDTKAPMHTFVKNWSSITLTEEEVAIINADPKKLQKKMFAKQFDEENGEKNNETLDQSQVTLPRSEDVEIDAKK